MPNAITADPAAEETRANISMVTRAAEIRPSSFNAEQNTVEVCWTTGARGARFDWSRWEMVDEELATAPTNVRLDRLNRGAAALAVHRAGALTDQIGVVVDGTARMENGEGIATIRLSRREELAPIVADIADGIIRNLSVGYRVHSYEITENEGQRPLYRAVDWEPYEISFVPVPFDAGAQVRSGDPAQGGYPCIIRRTSAIKENDMPSATQQPAGEPADNQNRTDNPTTVETPSGAPQGDQQRTVDPGNSGVTRFTAAAALAFVDQARAFGEAMATRASELVTQNEEGAISVEAARSQLLRDAAEAQRAAGGGRGGASPATIPEAQFAARAAAVQTAILHRADPDRYQIDDASRPFAARSLLGLARQFLEATGVRTEMMGDNEVARDVFRRSVGMHSTSDFPAILANTVNRSVRDAYQLSPRTYQAWSRRTTAPNFKAVTRLALSDAPALEAVGEGEEYTFGTFGEESLAYRVGKYGKRIAITWETLINDDLDAFSRIPQAIGARAAQVENEIMYGFLLDNANMADGYALFSAEHGNLANPGTIIDRASLSKGRVAMRKQTAPQGGKMNITPDILIVGPEREEAAIQYTSANVIATTNATINPEYNRTLQVVVDPLFEDYRWHLSADPKRGYDTVEYAYLAGEEGLMIDRRNGFEVDGLELKARLVFGGGVIEWRTMYKNPGAADAA
ncbi:prohead protease/major capsid protein fusion protein [Sphingomonas sp. YL-JM2C]